MKNRLPILLVLLLMYGVVHLSIAQTTLNKTALSYDTIRIATYNLLNYPGSTGAERAPYYRSVLHSMMPDVLVVQEMTMTSGQGQVNVDLFRNNVLNYYQNGLYASVPFHHTNSTSDTENSLFYKLSKIIFISASYIATDLRDIAEYIVTPIGTQDTIRIYSVHLKANDDAPSESQRLSEATILRNYLNNLPPGTKFIIVGDFNTYRSSDLGFQKLIESETDNDGRAKDPLNSVGEWHNTFSFRFIHTQSPRLRQFGGGSNGGMDDRFDLMLTSYSSLDDNIMVSHYTPYGNDGNHFNDSINHLPNAAVPDSVANGLHYASDHLPVYCDYRFALSFALGTFTQMTPSNGSVGQMPSGTLTWHSSGNATSYDVYLDRNNPPTTLVASGVTDTTYSYSGLLLGKMYRWKILARNATDSLFASNAPTNFSTINGPTQPTNMAATNVALDSLRLSWTDNATDEIGYRIYRSTSFFGPFAQDGSDLPPNTESFTDTGLSINQRYYYLIVPFNTIGEGNYGPITVATLAAVPGVPALTNVSYQSLTVTIDTSTNPSSTQFAIQAIHDTVARYVQDNGSLGVVPSWHTFAEWGGASGVSVTALLSCTQYTFHVKARNDDNIETAYGSDATQSTQCFSVTDSLLSGWNLLSIPVTVADGHVSVIFPTSTSRAYTYESGYSIRDSLVSGAGYWLKFGNAQPIILPGDPHFADSIVVKKGWNMVGSSSVVVDVTTITPNAGNVILSSFYGYNGSMYYVATAIEPMHGYWVKVNMSGKIFLPFSPKAFPKTMSKKKSLDVSANDLNSFIIEDHAGHRQILYVGRQHNVEIPSLVYELPPSPPPGSFDARFGSQRYMELFSEKDAEIHELPVSIQSSSYPVTISWNLNGNDRISFQWKGIHNEKLKTSGYLLLQKNDANIVLQVKTSNITSQPKAFALHQNYPNPFNPSTEIRYDLPSESYVRLTVFNVLGVRVATLVDAKQDAGFHRAEWQPSLASGIYFYRLEAAKTENPTESFQQVKRMLLLK